MITLLNRMHHKIFCLRGVNVMLDSDLAKLYGVSTSRLNEQVRRNLDRFPDHFCFQMSKAELDNWISQNATSKSRRMGIRKRPLVFTEYGVAMVSSVLKSTVAVEVSIQIIQSFIEFKRANNAGEILMTRIANVERIVHAHSDQLQELYALIDGGNLPKFGIFFNDQIFDAYVFSSELIASARQSIVLLDNYIDEKTLLQLSKRDSRVDCVIYTAMVNDQLRLDLEKHNAQYPKIELRVKKHFHDRFLIIDGKELYHLGASLKDLGKR
jgi:ORF6N domain